MTPRVVVYAKPGCHLCVDAESVVARVCADLDVGWESRDILGDPALVAAYSELIPVIFVDGAQHGYWRVDEQRLRAALTL